MNTENYERDWYSVTSGLFFATSAILGYCILPLMVLCCLEVRSMYEEARTSIYHLNKDLTEAQQSNHLDEAMEYKELASTYAVLCIDMREQIAILRGELAAVKLTSNQSAEKDESEIQNQSWLEALYDQNNYFADNPSWPVVENTGR